MADRLVHAFDYLETASHAAPPPLTVVFGDEAFLKRLVLKRLLESATSDPELVARFSGTTAEWSDVSDELQTRSLFGPSERVVVVQEADEFITRHRQRLESWAAVTSRHGILILDAASFASTTRLYKLAIASGLAIECRVPEVTRGRNRVLDERRVQKWIQSRGQTAHQLTIASDAAQAMWSTVGPNLGILDQELAKLALVAPAGRVSMALVEQVVGGWRTQTIWQLLDAACGGDAATALAQLDRLLQSGEQPLTLFGAIAWSLRRFAIATRIVQRTEAQGQRPNLRKALQEAGFRPWPPGALERAEAQLRQLTRHRAGQLFRWLSETDLALKGTHSSSARAQWALELLVMRMARQTSPLAHSS